MIQRLRELQSEEAKSRSGPATAAPAQNLPQDSQDETSQTSNSSAEQQEKKPGDDGKTSSQLGSAMKNGGCSGSSSTRLLPDFVYQASLDLASKEAEDRQGGRGAGGRRRVVKENGRKAKQKLNYTSSSTSFRTEDKEEEVERNEASKQQPTNSSTSWSEMSSMVIGSDYHLLPLSPAMEQRLILQYLTPLGDYQEVRHLKRSMHGGSQCFFFLTRVHESLSLLQLLAVFMQMDTRSLLMNYIDLWQTKTVQLTFDALLVRLSASKHVSDTLTPLIYNMTNAVCFLFKGNIQRSFNSFQFEAFPDLSVCVTLCVLTHSVNQTFVFYLYLLLHPPPPPPHRSVSVRGG